MSVSASSVGRSGGPPQASSSSITAAAATGMHQLKIDSYSLTKSLPCGAHIKSSNFQAAGYSWYINYFPNGCGRLIKRARDYLSLQLVLDDAVAATAGAVMAQFTLSVINSAGLLERTTARKSPVHNLARGGAAGWWFFKYMSKADLKSKFLDLKDDSFTLQCDVVIIDRFRAVKAAPFVDVPPPGLHRHLGELLFSGEASDVTLQAGGETFSAHRFVLAARSPVFKAKLLGSMKEGTSTTTDCAILIEDIEPRVLQAVLHFMYTDTLPEVSKEEAAMSQHLLEAADRFSLQRLKLICEENLCGCIDTNSVVTTLVLADQHSCQGLKEKCFEFLKSTGLNALIATDGFNHLCTSCPAVLEELTSKLTLH
jgi:speckle-type POZ protein